MKITYEDNRPKEPDEKLEYDLYDDEDDDAEDSPAVSFAIQNLFHLKSKDLQWADEDDADEYEYVTAKLARNARVAKLLVVFTGVLLLSYIIPMLLYMKGNIIVHEGKTMYFATFLKALYEVHNAAKRMGIVTYVLSIFIVVGPFYSTTNIYAALFAIWDVLIYRIMVTLELTAVGNSISNSMILNIGCLIAGILPLVLLGKQASRKRE